MNNNEKTIKNVAIYSRKSKYTGKGESIDNQIEMCKEYLRVNYRDDYDEMKLSVFEDEGYSGGNINRPQFQIMLSDIKKRKFDTVICYRLDRISRNTADFSRLMEDFNKLDVSFISMRDRFDTATSTGRAMMMMVSVFAQLERDTIAERVRDNMQELAKSGRWLGGTTPTGYESVEVERIDVDSKKKRSYKLKLINSEMNTVKLIYKKFLETNSLTQTQTYLMQQMVKSKNNKTYSRHSVKSILENPVYMIADSAAWRYFNTLEVEVYCEEKDFDEKHGIMAYNKTDQKTGRTNKKNDIGDWIIAVGKHKGIIAGSEWVKIQKMLMQNKSKSYRKPRSHSALLSGLLFCGECGKYMRPKQSSRLNQSGDRVYHYMCETKEKSKKQLCETKNINGNELDKAVCEEIKKLSADKSTFANQMNKAKKSILLDSDGYANQLKDLEKQVSRNEKLIQKSVETLLTMEGTVSHDYITKEMERLHNENILLKDKIEEIKCITRDYELSDTDFDVLKDMLSSFSKVVDIMTIEEKRRAIKTIVKKVIWDGEDIHLYFFGSEDDSENLFPLGKDSK